MGNFLSVPKANKGKFIWLLFWLTDWLIAVIWLIHYLRYFNTLVKQVEKLTSALTGQTRANTRLQEQLKVVLAESAVMPPPRGSRLEAQMMLLLPEFSGSEADMTAGETEPGACRHASGGLAPPITSSPCMRWSPKRQSLLKLVPGTFLVGPHRA